MRADRRAVLALGAAAAAATAVAPAQARHRFTTAEVNALRSRYLFAVYLDGQRLERVLDVDPDAGWAIVGAQHPVSGKYYLNASRTAVVTEIHHGRIDVEVIGVRVSHG
jgi:hypothetical protein